MPGYLVLLGGCLVLTLSLELTGAQVYRRPRRLLRTLVPGAVVLLVWDEVGSVRGQWHFPGRSLLGPRLPGGLPFEALLFFVVVPVCAMLTWEGLGDVHAWTAARRRDG